MSEEIHQSEEATTRGSSRPKWSWLMYVTPLLGIAILAYLYGMIVAISQSPPYHSVRDAWIAYCAFNDQQNVLSSKWPKHLWGESVTSERGLVRITDDSFGDFTSYSSADGSRAVLVDRHGEVVHEWHAPYRQVFPYSNRMPGWLPDHFILMRRALVYPNGDLLALFETIAYTPSGCGLAKLDLSGDVIWKYDSHCHHDFCVGDDQTIYVLNQQLRRLTSKDEELKGLSTVPMVEDLVTILSPKGKEVKTISLLDALVESPYFRPLITQVDRFGDITHNNTVDIVGAEFASHHEGVTAGDLLVCLRNLNLVAVLNLDTEEFVWATTGPWEHPHDPIPLANGNIMIFDNFLVQGPEYGSGVIEFNPSEWRIEWDYMGDSKRRLRSDIRACQQVLENGNVLITETEQGRIVEVDRDGKTTWEYVHPTRGGKNQELIPVVCGARRYTRQELPFVDNLPKQNRQPNVTHDIAVLSN